MGPELQGKIRTGFRRLDLTLKKKNLTLYKVFLAYDHDKSKCLTID
jgi:hypothetical protein